jgi:5-methyltetrahydrofolate--homocysteine methyltransferase
MNEHDFVRQISDRLVKGGLEAPYSQTNYGIKDRPGVPESIRLSMGKNMPPSLICADALDKAMNVSIKKYEDGVYTLPELIFRAKYTGDARDILWKQIGCSEAKYKGIFALATLAGEAHVHGKQIVALLLRGIGFKTIDFGIAVPTDEIIRSVKYHQPDYLGISISTASTIPQIEKTIEKLSENEYFENVKIIIGGYAVGAGLTESIDANSSCGDIGQTLGFLKKI